MNNIKQKEEGAFLRHPPLLINIKPMVIAAYSGFFPFLVAEQEE